MGFSVAPGLLVAMPTLHDPNFFRAVVLLCAHNEEGAFGLVVNKPLELTMEAVCDEAGVAWAGDSVVNAFGGGPVDRQRGWMVHAMQREFEGSQELRDGLAVTASLKALEAFGAEPGGRYRLMLGYAGWGPGQLDEEIAQGSWLTTEADPSLVLDTPARDAWAAALRSVGVDPTHLVDGGSQFN